MSTADNVMELFRRERNKGMEDSLVPLFKRVAERAAMLSEHLLPNRQEVPLNVIPRASLSFYKPREEEVEGEPVLVVGLLPPLMRYMVLLRQDFADHRFSVQLAYEHILIRTYIEMYFQQYVQFEVSYNEKWEILVWPGLPYSA